MDTNLDKKQNDNNEVLEHNALQEKSDEDSDKLLTESTPSSSTQQKRPKRILVIVLACAVLLGTAATLYVFSSNSRNDKSSTNNQTSQDSAEDKTTVENKTASANGLAVQPFESLYFVIPNGWLTEQIVTENNPTETILFSPDAEPRFNDYVSIKSGISVKITEEDIDPSYDPVTSLTKAKSIGRVDQPRVFSNKNGIEFTSIPNGYEGCYLDVFFKNDKKQYDFRFEKGDSCPTNDLLDEPAIASLFESVEIGVDKDIEGTTNILLKPIKGATVTEVRSKELSFRYTGSSSYTETHFDILTGYRSNIPKLDQDGKFSSMVLNSSREDTVKTYDCDGCGFAYSTYGDKISLINSLPENSELKDLGDGVFGAAEDTTPVQSDSRARMFTLYAPLGNQFLKFEFTYEAINGDPLPTLENPALLEAVKSIELL